MIKNLIKTALVSVLGFASVSLFAGAAEDLQLKLSKIESMQANFSQIVIDELGTELDNSKGSFQIERPKKFKWIVSEPYEQEIISDGVNLWQFDKDIEQINVSNLDDSFDNSPAALLSNAGDTLVNDYLIAQVQDDVAGSVIFHLRPKSEESLFESMLMEFKGDEFVAFQVKDNLGQATIVEFSEQQYNQKLPEDFFKFVPPVGMDLIDSRNSIIEAGVDLTKPPTLPIDN
ncbi:MAG: outer membrane lipoprotein chaperone LolA [Gammaproteobacteria bacterium]|nr:outer membrane lipoprotein chaperone LolA [Gammaproteobacteria bacterium]